MLHACYVGSNIGLPNIELPLIKICKRLTRLQQNVLIDKISIAVGAKSLKAQEKLLATSP